MLKGVAWLLLIAYSKMPEERNDLRGDSLSKKELALEDLKDPQSIYIAKNENTRSMAKRWFNKEICMGQPSQWKLEAILPDNRRRTEDGSETIKAAIPITGPESESMGRGCIDFKGVGPPVLFKWARMPLSMPWGWGPCRELWNGPCL